MLSSDHDIETNIFDDCLIDTCGFGVRFGREQ